MIFQSPYDSLNPRFSAADTIREPLMKHRILEGAAVDRRVRELMEMVELPARLGHRRPRELSGGQCQRVAIARALAMEPELLIADEITSALDVTTQAQVLDLLARLRDHARLTLLYITHDLAVMRAFCDRALVFQNGRIVEEGSVTKVMEQPQHPYTQLLLRSIPKLNAGSERAL
jgi:peptide/nickel transport system ATP-binding protein